MSELGRQLSEMTYGDHACLIYDSPEQQMATILPFVKLGLEHNEAILYIAPEPQLKFFKESLKQYQINVERELKRGALMLSDSTYTTGFVPKDMVSALGLYVQKALRNGFKGFRASGEMDWVLGARCGCEKLIEYEALLNENFPTQLVGICQYNRNLFDPVLIRDVLRTHPVIIFREQICRNLYCESAEFLGADPSERSKDQGVSWMLDNLTRFQTLEENLRHMVQVRDDFFTIASHELRTPVTALRLQNESRLRDLRKGIPVPHEKWKKLLNSNSSSIDRLVRIIEDIVDAASISRGRLRIIPEVTDLFRLVEETVEWYSKKFSSIPFTFSGDKGVKGNWDGVRLQQVVHNLLSNSVKYGEGKPVEVKVKKHGQVAQIQVTDHGMGISLQDQERVFGIYERAISFNKVSGFGLGLYICQQIVQSHQGKMNLESQLGKGSTFTVELPFSVSKYTSRSVPKKKTGQRSMTASPFA